MENKQERTIYEQQMLRKRLQAEREERKKHVDEMKELFAKQQGEFLQKSIQVANRTEHKLRHQARAQFCATVLPCFLVLFWVEIYVLRKMGIFLHGPEYFRIILFTLPPSLLVGLVFYGFARHSQKQILKLSQALEQAAMGNLDYRLDWNQGGPLGQAYVDYNQMCQQMRRAQKKMRRALEDAERANASKGNFLANMSHEIRTPINAVLGMDEMIIRESREKEIREYAMDIRNAGRQLLSIINDILDLSKIESGKMEIIPVEYDLSSVINDLLNMTQNKAKDKGLELIVNMNEQIPHLLYGDEIRIKQVALNVLSNAVKYTDQGKVTLEVDYEEIPEEEIKDFAAESYGIRDIYLCIRVVDTGKGIKEEDLDKLFAPFERIEEKRNRSIEGTGLGMNITKNLLQMMGSGLDVKSVYGEGSDFSFRIRQSVCGEEPIGDFVERYHRLQEKEAHYQEKFHAPNAKVLVIDDVEMNLTVIKNLLKATQIQVTTGASGKECIALAEREHYDIIFVDHMMPDMDGIETLQHLRQECPMNQETPVIVLTANAVSGAREQYLAAGFNDYLTKPIDSEKLEYTIQTYLPEELVEHDVVANQVMDLMDPVEEAVNALPEEQREVYETLGTLSMVDRSAGVKAAGGVEVYLQVVKDFFYTGEGRICQIADYYEVMDLRNYTIQVHALKSSARLVGALALSEQAEYLEGMGNAENEAEILDKTSKLLSDYRELISALEPIFESDQSKPPVPEKLLCEGMDALMEVMEVFDFDTADSIVEELSQYQMPKDFAPIFAKLKGLITEVERDAVLELLRDSRTSWKK